MINKIFVFGGLALWAILIVENMVSGMIAYIFVSTWWTRFLSLVSIITWIFIWYWLKWMFAKDDTNVDDYDF